MHRPVVGPPRLRYAAPASVERQPVPRLTPSDAAQVLFAIISRALSGAALEDYGITASREQGDQILREFLSLCLFWAYSALDVGLSNKDRDLVWAALQQRVRQAWEPELGLKQQDFNSYAKDCEQRLRIYEGLAREGGDPAHVSTEAVISMDADGAIDPADRPKVLALLIDLVPADELGEAVEDLEISD